MHCQFVSFLFQRVYWHRRKVLVYSEDEYKAKRIIIYVRKPKSFFIQGFNIFGSETRPRGRV